MPNRAIFLILPHPIIVAGQILRGEVELNFLTIQAEEIEEVHVKFRGSVSTKARSGKSTLRERRELVHKNISVWTRGSAYPPPESHRLLVPFSFFVPPNAPPSCEFKKRSASGSVVYSLEAVGVRSGVFHTNRRDFQPLCLVPFDPIGAQIREALELGWTGTWQSNIKERNIRKGCCGASAKVQMDLQLPAMDVLPLYTTIPFILQVVTFTKRMKHDNISADSSEPLFPAPPTCPSEINLTLRRVVRVNAKHATKTVDQAIGTIGGMGKVNDPSAANVDVQVSEKIWIPSEDNDARGVWMQESVMRSQFELTCPPTFGHDIIGLNYYMHLKVEFSGLFNDMKADIPINIGSGMVPPTDISLQAPGASPQALSFPWLV